jgi:hypothetical protein
VDGTGLGLCPTAGFDFRCVEPSGSVTKRLANQDNLEIKQRGAFWDVVSEALCLL